MKKDGPPPSSLSERLALRIESEKTAIEAHHSAIAATMAVERQKLAESLKAESSRALSAMRQLTDETIAQTQRSSASSRQAMDEMTALIRARSSAALTGIWPTILVTGVVVLSAVAILLGTSWWTARTLASTQREIAAERRTLSDLRDLTGRIEIMRAPNGVFVVLPEGASVSRTYNCEGRTCLRLPEN